VGEIRNRNVRPRHFTVSALAFLHDKLMRYGIYGEFQISQHGSHLFFGILALEKMGHVALATESDSCSDGAGLGGK